MAKYIVKGGSRIFGSLRMHGAKNAALPILAAALVPVSASVIRNCPELSDVEVSEKILRFLGCEVHRGENSLIITPAGDNKAEIPDSLAGEMRSSILFLGAMIARFGRARIAYPGGCELGPRPIDLHIAALRKLGVLIDDTGGYLDCRAEGRLVGCEITLPFPSVGATENIIIAASTAKGTTTIYNAAREPEIADLSGYINACGGNVEIHADSRITIEGVPELTGADYSVIPDRIAAATYLCAAAITGGGLKVEGVNTQHLSSVLPIFEEMGCDIRSTDSAVSIVSPARLLPAKHIKTMPYPGFPTDAQAPLMAVACLADGMSMFVENIFESRYKHAGELIKMGAKIKLEGRVAVVEGVPCLHSAHVRCTDLRGGAAMAIAALAAGGTTHLDCVEHIDRGYERFLENLCRLGADINRVC